MSYASYAAAGIRGAAFNKVDPKLSITGMDDLMIMIDRTAGTVTVHTKAGILLEVTEITGVIAISFPDAIKKAISEVPK